MITRLVLLSFLCMSFSGIMAQQFGGNPPSLKWKQLNSDTARIIYPAGLDSQAQRVASVVHFLAAKNNTLGSRLQKINMVLQNQTTAANGYVALGPYRSELFMTPPAGNFDLGSLYWPEALAVHEYRHVQQFNNFKTGLSKVFYYLFGEEGLAVAINAAVPDWFYEGDAVYNETVHTEQGRGRLPFFTNQYRSLRLADKKYLPGRQAGNWMKLRNGSLKDYIPTHYPLGYLLVNYGYEKYGADFWKKVTSDAAAYKGLFYPFQRALKKYSDVHFKKFRSEAFAHYLLNNGMEYKSATQGTGKQGTEAGKQNITTATENYVTNYFFPVQLGGDSLLYVKSSYRKRPAFVIKDNTGERRLGVRSISPDEHFSYRQGKIVYAAYEADARWGWRDYSVIRLMDITTGRQRRLTRKTKYFSPDISEDGKKIVAVDMAPSGICELHLLDASSGEVMQRIKSAEISRFTDPKFIDDHSIVTAVRYIDGQMALARVEIASGLIQRLTEPGFGVMGYLNVHNGKVFFTASFSGNDDLFEYDFSTKKIQQLTRDELGNYFVNVKDDKMVFSSFTADGYQLRKMTLPAGTNRETYVMAAGETPNRIPVARAGEYKNLLLGNMPQRSFASSGYKKSTRLFNFHSWRPYVEDPEFMYSLYGKNVLNTFQSELYYLYNRNEKTSAAGFNTTLGSLFPFISVGTQFTLNRADSVNDKLREWNQLDTHFGLNIPLNFSGGKFFRYLNFGSGYVLRNEYNTGQNKNVIPENNFSYLTHFIRYSQQVQRARQHIFPRFAYSFIVQHRHAVTKNSSYQFNTSGSIYLPGFFSTHSVVLNGSFQQRDTLHPSAYSNRFSFSRGYTEFYFSRMWKLAANYHFPVWIPDWGFGNILYLQRIRANGFYDFTKVYSRNKKSTLNQRSAGAEVYVDTKWWNQYPLTFGIRFSKLLDYDLRTGKRGTMFEFIIPVSIIPR